MIRISQRSLEPTERNFRRLVKAGFSEDTACAALGLPSPPVDTSRQSTLNVELALESLEQSQLNNALGGNATLQTWLCKNYLGQKDLMDENADSSVEIGVKVETE